MGSLLVNAALLGGGFALGRVPLLPLAAQLLEEVTALSATRKVAMATLFVLLVALYVLGVMLPLRWVAAQEAQKTRRGQQETTFRRELRRRGSYSMSYVTDIKAHVFARC